MILEAEVDLSMKIAFQGKQECHHPILLQINPVTLSGFFRDRYTRVELSILFLGGIKITY